jgi:hypothetical protein
VVENPRFVDAAFLCLAYALILMQVFNYPIHVRFHSLALALQGRYFFPVLVPFYGLVAFFLMSPAKRWTRIVIFSIVTAIFVLGDFPYFLQNATQEWFLK